MQQAYTIARLPCNPRYQMVSPKNNHLSVALTSELKVPWIRPREADSRYRRFRREHHTLPMDPIGRETGTRRQCARGGTDNALLVHRLEQPRNGFIVWGLGWLMLLFVF